MAPRFGVPSAAIFRFSSDARREIFLLSKRDGLKQQEIADRLHLSLKTVENQMGKALKSLREAAIRVYLFFFN